MSRISNYTKAKKEAQYDGGWAKHAYGSMHPLSNRRLRRRGKAAVRQLSLDPDVDRIRR